MIGTGAHLSRSLIDRTLGSDRSSGVEVDEESISDTVSRCSGSEASGEEVLEPEAVEVPVLLPIRLQLRAAWQAMDAVDMSLMFQFFISCVLNKKSGMPALFAQGLATPFKPSPQVREP